MVKKLTCVLFLIILATNALAQLPPSMPEYDLVFYDEFDSLYPTVVDTSKWARTPEWNQGTNITGDLSTWGCDTINPFWDVAYIIRDIHDTSTIKVNNGICTLLTDSADYMGEVWSWPSGIFTVDTIPFKYRTGMLYSRKKFKYGYFEIKYKLPAIPDYPSTNQGFGPNFWLFGADPLIGNWWSEIDVFEINAFKAATSDINKFTSTIHYSNKDTTWHPTAYVNIGNTTGNISHTASAWWTPEFIKIYYDDSLINTVENDPLIPVDSLISMNMYININSPAANYCTNFDTVYTQFPYNFEIDYVRVYQTKQECDTDKVYCNISASAFESSLYKSLTIGGVGCSAQFSSSSNVSGLGNNFVLLDEGFSFDTTSQGYFDVFRCDPNQYFGLRINPNPPQPPPSAWLRKNYVN